MRTLRALARLLTPEDTTATAPPPMLDVVPRADGDARKEELPAQPRFAASGKAAFWLAVALLAGCALAQLR